MAFGFMKTILIQEQKAAEWLQYLDKTHGKGAVTRYLTKLILKDLKDREKNGNTQ